jgi:hypothetical protein
MDAKISKDVLEAYVRCLYKAYLLLDGKREKPPPYAALREVRETSCEIRSQPSLVIRCIKQSVKVVSIIAGGLCSWFRRQASADMTPA